MFVRRSRKTAVMKKRKMYRRKKVSRNRVTNSYIFRRQAQLIRITQTAAGAITVTDNGTGAIATSSTTSDSMTNTIQWGNAFMFKLSNVIESADFVNLFDRYKILGVKLKVMYQSETASVGSQGCLPIFNYASDFDDFSPPSSLNAVEAKQRARSVILTANRPVNIYVKPKVAAALYQSLLTGYEVKKAPFINSTYPDVQHYGVKTWINNFYAPAGANNQITIQATYVLSCKDPQ